MRPQPRIAIAAFFAAFCAGLASAQTNPGTVRMSWNSCDTLFTTTDLSAGTHPKLVISSIGTDASNIGTDVTLYFCGSGGLCSHDPLGWSCSTPDAWRFDDLGCQGGSRLSITRDAFRSNCPPMRGANPLPITFFGLNGSSEAASLRLLDTYDPFVPDPNTRYTWWTITFDHSFSRTGSTEPGEGCGGVEQPLCIFVGTGEYEKFQILSSEGVRLYPNVENACGYGGDPCVRWEGAVATIPQTWGRVKATYR